MKINQVNNVVNFNAGYSSKFARMEKQINPKSTELFFRNSPLKGWRSFYNLDLKDNKAMALANKLCTTIFIKLRKYYDFRQSDIKTPQIFPQDIYVFNKKESDYYNDSGSFFVNNIDIKAEKNKPIFQAGTVFLDNAYDSLEYIDNQVEILHKNNILSTNHFLHYFIHEWLHAQFTKMLKERVFDGSYYFDRTMHIYQNQKLDEKEIEMVGNLIGTYAFSKNVSHYSELFAETWTKLICESLSKDSQSFSKNPIDILKSMPKEFQGLLEKVSQAKMYGFK